MCIPLKQLTKNTYLHISYEGIRYKKKYLLNSANLFRSVNVSYHTKYILHLTYDIDSFIFSYTVGEHNNIVPKLEESKIIHSCMLFCLAAVYYSFVYHSHLFSEFLQLYALSAQRSKLQIKIKWNGIFFLINT